MHGIEISESPNLNIMAKLKLYPIKIHIPKLGPQEVLYPGYCMATLSLFTQTAFYAHSHLKTNQIF